MNAWKPRMGRARSQDIRDLIRGGTFIAMMVGALFGYALLATPARRIQQGAGAE